MERFEALSVSSIRAELGEGALWDEQEQSLLSVDILGNRVLEYKPASENVSEYSTDQNVGTVVLTQSGHLLVALRDGIHLLDRQTGNTLLLCPLEPDSPQHRLNDGKCDPTGRFWVGSIAEQGPDGSASLYCLDAKPMPDTTHFPRVSEQLKGDWQAQRMLTGVTISNGLAWTSDGSHMYYVDTPTQRLDRFEFVLESGKLRERRSVYEFPPSLGAPDGMAIDAEGQLWVAMWGGSKVLRLCPRRKEITAEVSVPAKNVTSCAFGGPNLDELFITTARLGTSPEELARWPAAGGLFKVKLPVSGPPGRRFHAL